MKTLTLPVKGEILKKLDKGFSVTALSHEYGVAKSTICSIRKKKDIIIKVLESSSSEINKCKRIKPAHYPKMEAELYTWFLKMRQEHNIPVTGAMLREKAKSINAILKEKKSFHNSQGWLYKFKKRYGIRLSKIVGEKPCLNVEVVNPSKDPLQILELDWNQYSNNKNKDIIKEELDNSDEVVNSYGNSVQILDCNQVVNDIKIEQVKIENEGIVKEEEDNEIAKLENQEVVSCQEAIAAFDICISWAEQNSNNIEDILFLRKLRQFAVQSSPNQI